MFTYFTAKILAATDVHVFRASKAAVPVEPTHLCYPILEPPIGGKEN